MTGFETIYSILNSACWLKPRLALALAFYRECFECFKVLRILNSCAFIYFSLFADVNMFLKVLFVLCILGEALSKCSVTYRFRARCEHFNRDCLSCAPERVTFNNPRCPVWIGCVSLIFLYSIIRANFIRSKRASFFGLKSSKSTKFKVNSLIPNDKE